MGTVFFLFRPKTTVKNSQKLFAEHHLEKITFLRKKTLGQKIKGNVNFPLSVYVTIESKNNPFPIAFCITTLVILTLRYPRVPKGAIFWRCILLVFRRSPREWSRELTSHVQVRHFLFSNTLQALWMLIYQIPLPLEVSLKLVVLFILLPQRQLNLVLFVLFGQSCEKSVFDGTKANKQLKIYCPFHFKDLTGTGILYFKVMNFLVIRICLKSILILESVQLKDLLKIQYLIWMLNEESILFTANCWTAACEVLEKPAQMRIYGNKPIWMWICEAGDF